MASWQMTARSALVWSHSRPWATLCTLGDWRLSKGERGEGNEDCRWQQWQFNVFLLSTLRIEDRGSRGETNTHANIDHTPAGALSLSVVWLSVVLSRSSSLSPLGSRRLILNKLSLSIFILYNWPMFAPRPSPEPIENPAPNPMPARFALILNARSFFVVVSSWSREI